MKSLYLGLTDDDRFFIARSDKTNAVRMSPRAILRVRMHTLDPRRAMIESSKGGTVNADAWMRLFEIASRAALYGKGIKAYPQSSWKRGYVEIGGYTVKRVYRNGDVRVGCQKIKYLDIVRTAFTIEAMQRLAKQSASIPVQQS